MHSGRRRSKWGKSGRILARPAVAVGVLLVALLSQQLAGVAIAAGTSITSAAFSGGTGTALVSGTFYAKSGAALTLTVVTDTASNCVSLSGAHTGSNTTPSASDSTSKTWSFSLSAVTGIDGVRTTTVTASTDPGCATSDATTVAGYRVDNTAPTVTASLSPAPNSAGWNNSDVTITWSATDAGSGVASGPTPATDSQTVETPGAIHSSTATDRVGNVRIATTAVKLDKTAPTIVGSRSPAANANGWNNTNVSVSFGCSDGRSGIRTCTGPSSFSSNVAGQTVVGTAVDFAGNSSSTTVVVNVDKNAPTISGAPSGSPNGAGWYNAPVTISWTCADTGGSGFAAGACNNSTISTEGTGLSATKSVTDLAGNVSPVATSAPLVDVDLTAPSTNATPSFSGPWSSANVTVGLAPTDGLSGVAATHFTIDGGFDHTYGTTDTPSFTTDGTHTLQYWSVDVAGNEETHQTLSVGVDKSAPVVSATQAPTANSAGWNKSSVVVSFSCSDAASGIALCPAAVTVSGEGAAQPVTGIAFDNAGNSASASTSVSIDETAPTVQATAAPAPNANGWNSTPVVVSFTCTDALSGVASCPADSTLSGEGAGQSATGAALDVADNGASATASGINIDLTPPAVSVSGVVARGSYVQGSWSASCSSSDALSGVAVPATLSTSGGPTGTVTLTCRGASDRAGNAQAGPVSVSITVTPAVAGYSFGGFLRPISGGGALNAVNGGSAVPIKFSLGGYRGMNIFGVGFPASVHYTCSATPPSVASDAIATSAALSYDPSSDTYSLVWKTVKTWSGCRLLQLNFSDGSSARAYFVFR